MSPHLPQSEAYDKNGLYLPSKIMKYNDIWKKEKYKSHEFKYKTHLAKLLTLYIETKKL